MTASTNIASSTEERKNSGVPGKQIKGCLPTLQSLSVTSGSTGGAGRGEQATQGREDRAGGKDRVGGEDKAGWGG